MLKFIKSEKFYLPIIYLILGTIIYHLIKIVINKISKNKHIDKKKQTIISLVKNIFKYLIYIFIVLSILNVYGINTTSIIASIGIVGVIIGLALQDLIADFLAGICILFDDKYTIGDIVSVNNFKGEVINFGLMTTKIKSATGEIKIISNSSFKEVINYSINKTVLFITLDVAYNTNIELLEKVLKDLSEEKDNNKIKKEKYEKKVEDSNLTIKEMNTWLEFFGMDKYKVDKDFNLKYKENNISNKIFILSTGEISALAFSYYLSTLITGLTNEEKQKLIIIIDDPVNSLDYNKIYSFATAIKLIQKKISESNAPQLILFTHNMLFFNILVQTNWMKSKNAKVFELYKDGEKTKIRETKNYKDSLFVVQLSEIIKCANSNLNDIGIEKAYIYNDIRSVIENLCYLINPKYVDNDDKYSVLSTIFDIKNEEYMKLDYIINNNSHNEPMLNIEKVFDAEILYEACKTIANMINSKFSELYNYCLNYNIEEN